MAELVPKSRLGHTALSVQRVDLGHLMNECIEQLRNEPGDRVFDIQVEPLPACRGDVILLEQVLSNLLGNALEDRRKQSHARICVGATQQGSEYVFRIADNSVGFDMSYADKRLEVFRPLHPASEFSGSGVGPASVRRATERHGGRCWAESEPGLDAVFYFAPPLDTRA